MLTRIRDLPAGVIGFEVSGKLRAEDKHFPLAERSAAIAWASG